MARTRVSGAAVVMPPKEPSPRERLEDRVKFLVEDALGSHPSGTTKRSRVIKEIMGILDDAAKGE